MKVTERIMMGIVTVCFAGGVAALSAWRVSTAQGDAVVRLSWRAQPLRIEECRPLTEEELEGIPTHMRRSEECTGRSADYELRVAIDGGEPIVDTLAPSGLRRDRPVYVLRDELVRPGTHSLDVSFTALVDEGDVPADASIALRWSGDLDLAPGEVGLITLDDAEQTLVRHGG